MKCSDCGHAFSSKTDSEPTYYDPLKSILAYLLAGYGLINGVETAKDIFQSATGSKIDFSDLQERVDNIQQNNQLPDDLKQVARRLSWLDKVLLIEAAYLLIFTARPIEYEERLKINLLANAMEIGLEGVDAIIKHLRDQDYKGFAPLQIPN
ncbi:hypothetical protein MIB92_08550 [Aestuariirhabdus sp. Z084]|uniref:hypothetical protein n=1 Tax=Aestuariirhabdus haliotis TaxID=2918751 RepID=UPI00201B3E91|nr:hypothetical protein [Aestuariirhabdus haliotis]MCL6415698.1 hypothetical protein [Aestuariirhabdus haliotis]MCL6419776.1 hypothetical protein [Aestuariirhabdus haliotis]